MDSPEQKLPQNIPDIYSKAQASTTTNNNAKIQSNLHQPSIPSSNNNFIIPALPDKPKKYSLSPIKIATIMMVCSIGILFIAGYLYIKSQNTPQETSDIPDNTGISTKQIMQKKSPTPTSSNKLIFNTVTQAPKATPEPKAPIPTRNPGPGYFACDPNGICNNYTDPITFGQCPKTFVDPKCMDECGDKNIWCAN